MCIESSMNKPFCRSSNSETMRNASSIPVKRTASRDRLTTIIEQRFRFAQIQRIESLSKARIDRRQQTSRFLLLAVLQIEPRQAHRRPHLPRLCVLLLRNLDRLLKTRFGFALGFNRSFSLQLPFPAGCRLRQNALPAAHQFKLTFDAVK